MSVPELHYDDLNPQARACVMLIKLLNLNVELHCIDSMKGACPAQSCIEAPLFFHYDITLRDGHSILVYLCEYCRNECGMQLYPTCYDERLNVMNKLYFEAKVLFQRYCDFMMDMLKKPVARIDFDCHERQICNAYDTLDQFLCDRQFMAGNKFTIADVAIMATVSSLDFMFPIESFEDTRWLNLYNWLNCMRNMPIYGLNCGGIEKQRYIMDSIFQVEPSSPRPCASATCVCCNFGGQLSSKAQPEPGLNCIFNRDMPPQGLAGGMENMSMYKNCTFQRQQFGLTRPMSPAEFMPTYADIPQTSRTRRAANHMPNIASTYNPRESGGHGWVKRPTWNLRDKRRFPSQAEREDEAVQSLRVHKKFQNCIIRSTTDLRHRHFGSFQKGLPTGDFQEDYEYTAPMKSSQAKKSSKRARKCSQDEFELLDAEKMAQFRKRLGDFSLPEAKRAAMIGVASTKLNDGLPRAPVYRDQVSNASKRNYDMFSLKGCSAQSDGNTKRELSPTCEYRSKRSFTRQYEEIEELHYRVSEGAHHRERVYKQSDRVQSGCERMPRHLSMPTNAYHQDDNETTKHVMKHLQASGMIESPGSIAPSDVKKCPSWQEEFVEVESDHTCNCMDPFKYKKSNGRPTAQYPLRKCEYFNWHADRQDSMMQSADCVGCHSEKLPEKIDPKFQYEYFVEDDEPQKHPLLPFIAYDDNSPKPTVAEEMYMLIKEPEPEPDPYVTANAKGAESVKRNQEVDKGAMMNPWVSRKTNIFHDNGYSGAKYLLRIDENKRTENMDEEQDGHVESWQDVGKFRKILLSAQKWKSTDDEQAMVQSLSTVVNTCEKVDEAISCQTLDKLESYIKDVEMSQKKEAPRSEEVIETAQITAESSDEEVLEIIQIKEEPSKRDQTIEVVGDEQNEDVVNHVEVVAPGRETQDTKSFDRKSTTMNLSTSVAEKITKFEKLAQGNGKVTGLKYSLKNRIKCYDMDMRHEKYLSHTQLVTTKLSKPIQGNPMVEPNLMATIKRSSFHWTSRKESANRHKDNNAHKHIGELGEIFDFVLASQNSGKLQDQTDSKELKEIYVNKLSKCMRSDSDDMLAGIESRKSPTEVTTLKQLDVEPQPL